MRKRWSTRQDACGTATEWNTSCGRQPPLVRELNTNQSGWHLASYSHLVRENWLKKTNSFNPKSTFRKLWGEGALFHLWWKCSDCRYWRILLHVPQPQPLLCRGLELLRGKGHSSILWQPTKTLHNPGETHGRHHQAHLPGPRLRKLRPRRERRRCKFEICETSHGNNFVVPTYCWLLQLGRSVRVPHGQCWTNKKVFSV